MLLTLAWRNLWRNKRRTFITMASIFLAVVLSIFMNSIQDGAYDRMIDNLVGYYSGYAQVHQNGYWDEQSLENSFERTEENYSLTLDHQRVSEVVPRLESFALASSERITKTSMVVGVDPEEEDRLTSLKSHLVEGEYLNPDDDAALVGIELARQLDLGLGDTLILIGQGYHGVTAAGQYPVKGLLKFGAPDLNKQMVYLPLKKAQALYGAEGRLTSYALGIDDVDKVNRVVKDLRQNLSDEYEVMDWKEMMPEFVQLMEVDKGGNYITLGVLYLIISFGIFGTVLMMVMERHYEFGVLVAIGMSRFKLAITVVLETIMIAFLGVLSGTAVAFPLCYYFYLNPIYLGDELQEAYESFGFEPILPASMDLVHFYSQAIVVLGIAVLIAIYPFVKVLRLDPIKSMKA